MSFLLDTNVISQTTKRVPNAASIAWLDATPEERIFLSAASLIELRAGIDFLPEGKRKTILTSWLTSDLPARLEGRILPITTEIGLECGSLIAASRRNGFNVETIDALIAATARVHGFSVVTLNRKHFVAFGVSLVDF